MKRTIFLQDENALWLKGNLHSHTVFSDGTYTPEDVVRHAVADGAGLIAAAWPSSSSGWAGTAGISWRTGCAKKICSR